MLLDILEINNLGIENLNAIIRKSMNLTGSQEVVGSNPIFSTLKIKHVIELKHSQRVKQQMGIV